MTDFCTAAYAVIARWVAGELTDEEFVQAIVDLLPPAAGTTGQGGADCRQPVEASVPVDNDERMVVGVMLGEFSQGDTKVTVDSTLPEDTGLEVILPSELESGGETIEELVITLRETDADVEIDDDLFGYTGDDADHVLVDIDISPVPDAAVRICLPVTEGLRIAAGERRLYLIRFYSGTWEELSSTVDGGKVCADSSGFSPFAVVYERINSGSGTGYEGPAYTGGAPAGCPLEPLEPPSQSPGTT